MRHAELGLAEILPLPSDYPDIQVAIAWCRILCWVKVGKQFVDNKSLPTKVRNPGYSLSQVMNFLCGSELPFK